MRVFIPTTALILALSGCDADRNDPGAGGQFGEEGSGCVAQSETPIELDAVQPNGLSAQDVIDAVGGSHGATVAWSDGGTASLALDLTDASSARWVDYEYETDGTGPVPEIACIDTVAVDFALSLTTDDGRIDLSGTHTVELADSGSVTTWVSLDDNAGTLDPAAFSTESFDDVWADLELVFDGPLTGAVTGYGEKTEGSGPDGTVSLTMFEIGTLTAATQ